MKRKAENRFVSHGTPRVQIKALKPSHAAVGGPTHAAVGSSPMLPSVVWGLNLLASGCIDLDDDDNVQAPVDPLVQAPVDPVVQEPLDNLGAAPVDPVVQERLRRAEVEQGLGETIEEVKFGLAITIANIRRNPDGGKAFRALLRAWHPDKNLDNPDMSRVIFQWLVEQRSEAI